MWLTTYPPLLVYVVIERPFAWITEPTTDFRWSKSFLTSKLNSSQICSTFENETCLNDIQVNTLWSNNLFYNFPSFRRCLILSSQSLIFVSGTIWFLYFTIKKKTHQYAKVLFNYFSILFLLRKPLKLFLTKVQNVCKRWNKILQIVIIQLDYAKFSKL